VIERDYLKGGKNLLLAWKFSISSLNPNNEQLIYVDAITGDIINTTPQILDTNTPLTAQTKYSGTLVITGDSYAGGYRLRETKGGVNIETLNLQNTYNYSNAIDFTNTNTNFTNGNWANLAQDQQALDAHWGEEEVLDFWETVFNRNSLDDNGIRILGYVHAGNKWDNAQWVGGTGENFMQYGDGDGTVWKPLTSLDICGHEMGHGIDQFSANLTPGTQESGALNEGFSDIWGASIEHWAAPNKQTWLMGEDVFYPPYTCLRNLQDPKSTTAWEGLHPNTYHGQFWSSNGEPHTNSTVLSHWFYLISQGGSGTNDNSDSYSVTGIGITEAEQISWRTESFYLSPTSDYLAVRTESIQAAKDLYCDNSPEVIAVTNAWYAVGVGAAYSGNTMSILGATPICTTNTFTVINQPTGVSSITWSTDNPNIATINSSGVATRVSNGTATIYAIVDGTGGCSTQLSDPVQVGLNTPSFVVNALDYCQGSHFSALATSNNPGQTISSYNWFLDGSPQSYTGFKLTGTFPSNNNYIELSVSSANCGTSDIYYVPDLNCSGGYDFIVAPNPASNTVTITTTNTGKTDTTTNTASRNSVVSKTTVPAAKAIIRQVKIVDVGGRLMKQMDYSTPQQQVIIDVTTLNPGIYFVSISGGKSISSKKLLIQR